MHDEEETQIITIDSLLDSEEAVGLYSWSLFSCIFFLLLFY